MRAVVSLKEHLSLRLILLVLKKKECNRAVAVEFFFYDSIWLRTPLETHFHLLDVGQP